MSGAASTSVTMGLGGGFGGEVGYGGYKPPFTAMQLQELERQAMIYKYLVAGLPIPLDLVVPIRRSIEMISARLLHHPSSSYCSYYGKKFDPEPGRCRRTDGKKWRCSKNAHPDSKYCERHMLRSRNRSRKPVESQSNLQSMSTALSHISTGCSSNSGSFQVSVSGSFQNMPLQMDPFPYGINGEEFRYMNGTNPDADECSVSAEASGSVGSLGLGSSSGSSTWHFMPSQVTSSSFIKHKPDSRFLGHCSTQQNVCHAFEFIDSTRPKELQQHCFFGSEVSSAAPTKQERHPVHPFFSEWPTTKEPWSNLDEDKSNKNVVSSTQLSISIPRASSGCSSSGANSPSGNALKIFS